MMTAHEFTFIVGGIDPHADDFEDRFFEAGCDDATLALMHGAIAVCFEREAENYKQAVLSAYENIIAAGAKLERFEPDFLVTASEIAVRANISKAAVSLYERGERGEGFPAPRARVTTSSPLWDWVSVSHWLYQNGKVSHSEVRHAVISRAINFSAQMGESYEYAKSCVEEHLSHFAA